MLGGYTIPLVLAAACAALLCVRPAALETSLYDLVGDASSAVPSAVRGHSANIVPLVVHAEDPDDVRAAADDLFSRLPTNGCAVIRYRFDGEGFAAVIDACRRRLSGLASPRDAELLATAEGRARIARAAARKYYSSPVPPLFPPAEDPFCLADGFVMSLPVSFSGWTPKDGVLQAERGDETFILIVMELERSVANDTDALVEFGGRLAALVDSERAAHPGVGYSVSGVPMHTAATAGRCKAEIGYLTWFSLVFIAALSLFAFRSAKWIPLLAASLLTAASAGALALVAVFRSVHLMTLVFGTTILGLVIDYSFHWLLHSPARRRETVRSLLVSFATTEISLLPLMASSLPVLRQAFVFLGVGLAAALAFVLFTYPKNCSPEAVDVGVEDDFLRFRRISVIVSILLLLGAAFGLPRLGFATDPQSLYRPSPELAAAERLFAELGGTDDQSLGFLVTSGSTDLETLIDREAAAGLPDSTPCLSRFLPPLSRRLSIAELVERLYAEHGESQRELLGLDAIAPQPCPEPWRWDDLPPAVFDAFVADGSLLVPSAPPPEGVLPEGVSFCRPREALGEVLSVWTRETRVRLCLAFALMFVALVVFFRLGAFVEFLPSFLAVAFVWGVVSLLGESVNLFHLLACFLLAGMGVDYAVFLHSGGRAAFKPALCSLLTSMAGFGALAFVSFPVVRAFGLVLGIGLPAAFLFAVATARRQTAESDVPSAATEHGASPLGLETLFLLYRVFGLGFLHFCASCVGLAVWGTSRAVRRASPSSRKVVAFTRSLADKLVVMAEGRQLPLVELDGSADSREFAAAVAEGKGVFVLSSHCGTIEVLAALGECSATFHAWMEFMRTSVFNAFYMRHANRRKVVIHPISEFGPETVFMAGDALDAGDCLVMAGDRGFGRMHRMPFMDSEIVLPEGAFRFARALAHPVYFVACVAVAPCRYRAIVRRLPDNDANSMARAYAAALEAVVKEFPEQWFTWGERGK